MLVIEEILKLLGDGKWRDLDEIVEKTRINKFKVGIVTNFLAEFDFIQLDENKRRARLTPSMLNLFRAELISLPQQATT